MTIVAMIIVVLLFLAAIVRNIDWRAHAVKWVGNNPSRSQHYIEAGDTVHTIEGHRVYMSAEGQVYIYEDLDKETYVCDLPGDRYDDTGELKPAYPYKYIRGRRIIGQSDGKLVSNPLGFFRPEIVALMNEGLTATSELSHGDHMIKAIKSVKSNKGRNSLIWLLVIALAVGGFMYWRNSQKAGPEIPSANVTQNGTMPVNITPGKIVPISPPSATQPGERTIP